MTCEDARTLEIPAPILPPSCRFDSTSSIRFLSHTVASLASCTGAMVRWDSESKDFLLDGLRKAVTEAQTGDNNFQPQVYQHIAQSLTEKGTGDPYTAGQQFKAARNVVHYLRNLSGFGWDEGKQLVVAPEAVWQKLLYDKDGKKTKKSKEYSKWRTKPFPQYDTVTELMGGNQAVGDQAFSSATGEAAAPVSSATVPDLPNEQFSRDEGSATDPQQGIMTAPSSPAAIGSPLQNTLPASGPPSALESASAAASSSKWLLPPPPATPVKRTKSAHTQSQLTTLVGSVDRLVAGLVATPGTESQSLSPLRTSAWEKVKVEEGLSPHSLSRARWVFRSKDSIKEYLSFGDEDAEARAFWLQDEIELAHSQV
ncbi:hypothetical protein BN946_scf184668.g1 [Trametes cinnabarina]|uniref:Myb/SANT-like domain-containing protein n=1 Tax=Pycnoporus cinnabarinus TaxID=5643 RepID=A0A060STK9_PYCCI|nr:hypothetical protein BN946_scf184668.g1 [Trametes cinnabarina]